MGFLDGLTQPKKTSFLDGLVSPQPVGQTAAPATFKPLTSPFGTVAGSTAPTANVAPSGLTALANNIGATAKPVVDRIGQVGQALTGNTKPLTTSLQQQFNEKQTLGGEALNYDAEPYINGKPNPSYRTQIPTVLNALIGGFSGGHGVGAGEVKPIEATPKPTLPPAQIRTLATNYIEKFGNTVNTDDARELFPSYQADRTTSAAVHEDASAIAKEAYQQLLTSKQGEGNNIVLFTAGGTGSGKTAALKALGNVGDFPIIYDTNMNKLASAAQKIDDALAHGFDVKISYVHNDIQTALDNALSRAENMRTKLGSGRTVPLEEHLNTHIGAPSTIAELAERYAGNNRVEVAAIDNTGNVTVPIHPEHALDFIRQKRYNVNNEQLSKQLEKQIHDAHQSGHIGEETKNGFLGSKSELGTRLQRHGEGPAKSPQEKEVDVTATPRSPKSPPPPGSDIPTPPLRGSGGEPPTNPPISSYDGSLPDGSDAVQKVIHALQEAKPLNREQLAIYHQERSQRAARVTAAGRRVPGEQGYFAQLGALKGAMPKVQFEALRKSLTQPEIDHLFNIVEQHPNILPFEKVTAKTALAKLLHGEVPTKSEISLLSEIFPKPFIDAILAHRPLFQKLADLAGEIANIPRSFMSSFDVSAPLRQGIFFVGRVNHWVPAFGQMFKYLASEKAYKGLIAEIEARPTYKAMREAKLAITDTAAVSLSDREERFMSNLAERIPLIGPGIRASGRAYTGFLVKLRADVFDDLVKQSKKLGVHDADLNIGIARYVNSATGRGDLGVFNRSAVILNATLFSPRLMASRLNLINPVFYVNLPPFVRKQALKDLFTFGSIAGTVIGLSKLGGAEVENDPTSADFAKAKFGHTRYDILGGFQQYIRLTSQLIEGKIKSSTTGRTITLGEGYKAMTRKDILIRFFESKEAPVMSFASGLLTGQDALGRDFHTPTEIASRFIPMVSQDMYDLYQDKGLEGLVMGLPTPFGVGTQTYGKVELVDGTNPIGEKTAQVRPIPGLVENIIEKTLGKQALGSSKNFDVEVYYDQLKTIDPDTAKSVMRKIAEDNPDLAQQILDVKKDRELGVTPRDKDLKSKGVASGDRALAIIEDLKQYNTPEEKKAYLKELVRKKVMSDKVFEQVQLLMGRQTNSETQLDGKI